MDFLLAHWHCILPALGIIVAMFLMRDKKGDRSDKNDTAVTPHDYQE